MSPPLDETPSPPVPESFCAYLARKLMVEEGFTEGTVPEAQELASSGDMLLTYSDGYSCVIVCLVDREADAARRFTPTVETLLRVGTACLGYTGTVNNSKLPVGLHVIEVGHGPLSPEDRERLSLYRAGLFSKVHLSATYLDTAAREAWSNHRIRQSKPSTRLLRRLLREPRRDAVPETETAAPPERSPVLTYTLLGLITVAFLAEHLFSLGGDTSGLWGPSLRTLWGVGALNRVAVVDEGQWWRLVTATLLHGDLVHLLLNGVCLGFSAWVLERMAGRAWLGVLFIASGLGGGLLSLALNTPETVSVGASGAIMGLLAAILALSHRAPRGMERTQLQMSALRLLLPSLIPLASRGEKVDFAAHLGGALVGGALGWVLARVWNRNEPVPPGTRLAGAVGGLAVVALAMSVGFATRAHAVEALEVLLIPQEAMPTTDDDIPKMSADLLARYPRDPRSHFFQAITLLNGGDGAGAERELRAGLAEREILEHFFPGKTLTQSMNELLGDALMHQGREAEAREVVRPYCHAGEGGTVPERLQEQGLCDPAP